MKCLTKIGTKEGFTVCYQVTVYKDKDLNQYRFLQLSNDTIVEDLCFTVFDDETERYDTVKIDSLLTEEICGVVFHHSDMHVQQWELVSYSRAGFELYKILGNWTVDSTILCGGVFRSTGISNIQRNSVPVYESDGNEVYPLPSNRSIYDVILMYAHLGQVVTQPVNILSNGMRILVTDKDIIVIGVSESRDINRCFRFEVRNKERLKQLLGVSVFDKSFEPLGWF